MNRLSRLFVIGLCMLLVFSMFAGCTAEEPTTEEPTTEEPTTEEPTTGEVSGEGLTIALSQQHLTNDWNLGLLAGVEDFAEEIGAELITANARGDSNQQVADIENFLTLGVDAVIIGGGEGPAFEPIMRQMAEDGIPCITVDIASEFSSGNVTSDNFNGGQQLSLYVVNRMRGNGNILVLDTPGWQSLVIRIRMLEAVVMDYPNVNIAQTISIGTEDAVNNYASEVRAYLQGNPDTQAIYCSWGLAAVGAAQAVRELGLQDEVFITCVDADQVVLEEMRQPDSPLTAVVGQFPERLGSTAVELAVKAINGEEVPVETYAPIILIEKTDPNAWFSSPAIMTIDEAWDTLYGAQ
jgi:ABC-type sugar transport system substrate-binding protein